MTKQLELQNSRGLDQFNERPYPHNKTYAKTRDPSFTTSRQVSFSKFSTRRVYISDPHYEDWKSYTSVDRKIFQKDAVHDALEIKRLVSSCHAPTGLAVQQLMKQRLLTREQLLGIEHLLSVNTEEALQKRQSYIKLVLDMQDKMRERNDKTVNFEMLAAVAIARSSRMIEKARLRAALAL